MLDVIPTRARVFWNSELAYYDSRILPNIIKLNSKERILSTSFFIPAGFAMSRRYWSFQALVTTILGWLTHLASISYWYRSDARQMNYLDSRLSCIGNFTSTRLWPCLYLAVTKQKNRQILVIKQKNKLSVLYLSLIFTSVMLIA